MPCENLLQSFFRREGIWDLALSPFSRARLLYPRKLERLKEAWGSLPEAVLVFLVPYYVGEEEGNISLYARSRDYHLYFQSLFARLECFLREGGSSLRFAGFSDNSPVDEVELALRCGLGVRGDNGLLIHPDYGSYCFIGEIFFESVPDLPFCEEREVEGCLHCGGCAGACPVGCAEGGERADCLSALSQKKKLEPREEMLLRQHGVLWGCDRCQSVCPMNRHVKKTPISFFREERIPFLTEEVLQKLSRWGKWEDYAFSWRGKDVLLRNLSLTL